MQPGNSATPISKGQLWAGRILSGLAVAFFLFDAVGKFIKPAVVVETTVKLGYAESVITPLGLVLLVCTLLYTWPRTSVLGAILLTGYLGGAVATHVRAGGTLFEIVFPVIFGILVWGGLYLRNTRLRALLPLT